MERKKSERSVDRISALPDSILGVILSLLPTKNALATSTLSKRWEFLWRTVYNLDFCLEDENHTVEDESKKFVGYVNHVLLHNDAGVLNKFCLVWRHYCVTSHVTSWVKTAITRNVHELSITLADCRGDFDMPLCVFSCDSLRTLKLSGRPFWVSAGTVFFLPRLESLDLEGVSFESEETFEKMMTGCPVLNDLRINMEMDVDDFRFVISSTSLRHLEVDLGLFKHLKLEASSLEDLKIYGVNLSVNLLQKKLTSLVEASIYLAYMDFPEVGICNAVVDAVSALDCVKNLTLSEHVMWTLSCGTTRLSTNFNRLVKLMTSISCCDWSSLLDIIQRSNNLEALIINKDLMDINDDHDHDYDHSNWTSPVEVPKCLSNSLKNVVIDGYYGYVDERELIRYMLKHGSVLEAMEISYHISERYKTESVHDICEFPRKSPACEVKLYGFT